METEAVCNFSCEKAVVCGYMHLSSNIDLWGSADVGWSPSVKIWFKIENFVWE